MRSNEFCVCEKSIIFEGCNAPSSPSHTLEIQSPVSLSMNYKPSRSVKQDGWIRA